MSCPGTKQDEASGTAAVHSSIQQRLLDSSRQGTGKAWKADPIGLKGSLPELFLHLTHLKCPGNCLADSVALNLPVRSAKTLRNAYQLLELPFLCPRSVGNGGLPRVAMSFIVSGYFLEPQSSSLCFLTEIPKQVRPSFLPFELSTFKSCSSTSGHTFLFRGNHLVTPGSSPRFENLQKSNLKGVLGACFPMITYTYTHTQTRTHHTQTQAHHTHTAHTHIHYTPTHKTYHTHIHTKHTHRGIGA